MVLDSSTKYCSCSEAKRNKRECWGYLAKQRGWNLKQRNVCPDGLSLRLWCNSIRPTYLYVDLEKERWIVELYEEAKDLFNWTSGFLYENNFQHDPIVSSFKRQKTSSTLAPAADCWWKFQCKYYDAWCFGRCFKNFTYDWWLMVRNHSWTIYLWRNQSEVVAGSKKLQFPPL